MGVRDRETGGLMMTEEEKEAASEYFPIQGHCLGQKLIEQVSIMRSAFTRCRMAWRGGIMA